MRKTLFILFIMCVCFIYSCTKTKIQNSRFSIERSEFINPFDEDNVGITNACIEFKDYLNENYYSEDTILLAEYIDVFETFFNENFVFNLEYKIFENTTEYEELVSYFNEIITADNEKLRILISLAEQDISLREDLEVETKNILLYNLSCMRLIIEGFEDIIAPEVPWDERVDDCIRDELTDIFDNPVLAAAFIAGIPGGSFFVVVAACVWEATYGSYVY